MDTFIIPDNQAGIQTNWGKDIAVEASELGLPVATWPKELIHKGESFLYDYKELNRQNELIWIQYKSAQGVRLTVWND